MTENTTPYIQVRDLRKLYQMGQTQVHALAGVTLDLPPRSFTVVMGPSGSGKSTLLHLVGGLDRPTAGQIVVGGRDLGAMNENELAHYRQREVGFVFQSFNLLATMTALENVAFPMRFAGGARKPREQRAAALLERVGLGNRAHHRPSQLSGGQQQRVAIARSLINDPHLILGDEPTGNLDTASGLSVMRLLAELYQDGRSVLVVTHDLRMRAFATHTIYLLDGKQVDEPTYMATTTALATTDFSTEEG